MGFRLVAKIYVSLIQVLLLIFTYSSCVQGQLQQQYPLASPTTPKADVKELYTREHVFGFGSNEVQYEPSFDLIETVNSETFGDGVTGKIRVERGNEDQRNSFAMRVRISSATEEALDYVMIQQLHHGLIIDDCEQVGSAELAPTHDLGISIEIAIFVRPNTQQLGMGTIVSTENLDIELCDYLSFALYNLHLSSEKGTISSSGLMDITAHEIRVQASGGRITGYWPLLSSVIFGADAGDIDVDIITKRWSSASNPTGVLNVTTESGNIAIRMPVDQDDSPVRRPTTQIQSVSGSIHAVLVHGTTTSLETIHGSINATLLPQCVLDTGPQTQLSEIVTSVVDGRMHNVEVLPPLTRYGITPFFLTDSRHRQGTGRINLRYPGEWSGTATGRVLGKGLINVRGGSFNLIDEKEIELAVRRRPTTNTLLLEIDNGTAELILDSIR